MMAASFLAFAATLLLGLETGASDLYFASGFALCAFIACILGEPA